MADFKVSGSSVPGGLTGVQSARLTGRAEQVSMPWHISLAMEGKVFSSTIGGAATPVDFVETTYDENQPQFALTVPQGITVMPLSSALTVSANLATITLMVFSTTSNDIGSGSSTAMTIVPTNMNTSKAAIASRCTAQQLYTGDAVTATNLIEFWRWDDPFADNVNHGSRRHGFSYLTDVLPYIVGPGTLQMHLYGTGNAVDGYLNVTWAEFDSGDIE